MTYTRHEPALKPKINIVTVVLAVIFAGFSACFSLFIWIVGVGIDRSIHNAMGIAFVAINIGCWIAMTYYLHKGKNGIGIGISIAPGPLAIALVFSMVGVCELSGRQC